MTLAHKTDLIPPPPIQTRIYPVLVAVGFLTVLAALIIGIALATTAADVFENSKAVRDAAVPGSSLLADQSDLASIPLWVQPLKFLGIGILVTGIFTVFWGLLRSLREARGAAMLEAIPLLLQQSAGETKGGE